MKIWGVCEACDGDGSMSYQMAKVHVIEVNGYRKFHTDGRKGFYYVDNNGADIEMKTIDDPCSGCQGFGITYGQSHV